MDEVEIKFERENLSGIVPVGSYLLDAAKRMGIRFEAACIPAAGAHFCLVEVRSGAELLSPLTAAETAWFANNGPAGNRRLACQARIEKAGEIAIMTEEKKKSTTDEAGVDDKNEQYKKEFAEMPLEKKIASLVQLEAIALGETFSFILNSPYLIFDKAMDVMAEFGFKKEADARRAARPEEHADESDNKHAKAKGGTRKRAPKEKPAE
jgi:ferredoxin